MKRWAPKQNNQFSGKHKSVNLLLSYVKMEYYNKLMKRRIDALIYDRCRIDAF